MGWRIELQQAENMAAVFGSQYRTVESVREAVRNIKNNCAVTGQSRSVVVNTLNNLMKTMDKEAHAVNQMGSALRDITGLYGACEQRLVGNAVQQKPAGTEKTETVEKEEGAWTWKDTWDLLAEGGIVGAGTSMLGNWITGERDIGTVIDSGKYLNSIIGNGADIVAAGGTKTAWLEYLFGANNALSELDLNSGSKAFIDSLRKQFGSDLDFKNVAGKANKVNVGTKWAGHFLTLLSNGWENYEEFQTDGISAERAVTETVIETGVDIGLGALATAGVSAVAVAIGFTAAPALAIGAGAVLVTWAANGVCKWITGGRDIGEVAADMICDVGEGVRSVVQNVGEGLKKAGTAVVDSLKNITAGWAKAFA